MGFDAIDRKFRKPGPVEFECSQCECADDTVEERQLDAAGDDTTPLCSDCWMRWQWSGAGC
jgi:hypothetical protein